jgi:hypothetical protein
MSFIVSGKSFLLVSGMKKMNRTEANIALVPYIIKGNEWK